MELLKDMTSVDALFLGGNVKLVGVPSVFSFVKYNVSTDGYVGAKITNILRKIHSLKLIEWSDNKDTDVLSEILKLFVSGRYETDAKVPLSFTEIKV